MENFQTVIVRAFGDEPCQLHATTDGESVVVFRESPEAAIPYPRAFLYEWDGALFGELRAAFQQGSHALLASLWERARFYAPHQAAH